MASAQIEGRVVVASGKPAISSVDGESSRRGRREAVRAFHDAIARDRAVTGLSEVWWMARQGRGELLVVEDDYHPHAVIERNGMLQPAENTCSPDVLDDPVEAVVQTVLQSGGTAQFVGSGELQSWGKIGLVLRR